MTVREWLSTQGYEDQYSFGKNILDCWVEGIGSLTYGTLGDRIYWVGSSKRLLQCKQGDEVLYSVDIATSIQTPQINEVSSNIRFDLQGRPVKSTPKHGIYIKDGRKTNR